MSLFLGFLFFLIFNGIFHIDAYLYIIIYIVYFFTYVTKSSYVSYIFSFNLFSFNLFSLNIRVDTLKKIKNFKVFLRLFFRPNLTWKPLFKKSSYFGLYRASKNQWLNK